MSYINLRLTYLLSYLLNDALHQFAIDNNLVVLPDSTECGMAVSK